MSNITYILKRAKVSDEVIKKVEKELEFDYVPKHELIRANESIMKLHNIIDVLLKISIALSKKCREKKKKKVLK
jgi:hypothetical protein